MLKFKNNVLKKVILMSIMVVLVISTTIYASDGSMQTVVPGVTSTPKPTATPTSTATSKPIATPKPTSQTKLPQTGIEDYTGLIFTTLLLIGSAVFAYNKIKEYNNF